MSRQSTTAAALLGLALAACPLWADSQDQQTHRHLRAYLGVGVSQAYQEGDQQEEGVFIQHVQQNSPAARAGLRQGDVITRVGRRTVEDFRDLSNAITRLQPGEQVSIQVVRNGRQRNLRVTLASQGGFMQDGEDEERYQQEARDPSRDEEMRDQQSYSRYDRDQQGRQRGQLLQRLTQRFQQLENRFEEIERQARGNGQQRQYGRLQDESGGPRQALQRLERRVEELEERLQETQPGRYRQGLTMGIQGERFNRQGSQGFRITDLDEDSTVMEAGLRRGDVILRVDGRTVTSTQDLRQAFRQAEPGQEVNVEVLRNGRRIDIDVRTPRGMRSQARGYQRLQQRVEQLESRIREMEED
jgi:C-terminal processing protease CtpA/Prc